MVSPTDRGGPSPAPLPPPPARRKVTLQGVPETLVIPLYAKALDSRDPHSILHDRAADRIVRSLDYDFDRLRFPGRPQILAARARQIDEWVREFVAAHPEGTVLNLGCGLDARYVRVQPPTSVLWLDLDLPEVIALRQKFLEELGSPRTVATSVTSPGWLEELPADRPTLAVADGVFEYLTADDVRSFVGRLTAHFAHGGLVLDVMNSYAVGLGNARLEGRSEARLRWAVDDLAELDRVAGRWRRTGSASALGSRYLPFRVRMIYAIAFLSRRLRTAIRLVRYEF